MSCSSGIGEDVPRCTSTGRNAHKTEAQRLEYKWHPLHGQNVIVYGRVDRLTGATFRCQLSEDTKRDRLEVPTWMFDGAVCAQMRAVHDPHVTLRALTELKQLLVEAASGGPGCQDWPRPEKGGANDTKTVTSERATSAGSLRSAGPDTELDGADAGPPGGGDKVGRANLSGALDVKGRVAPRGGRA